jgi:hypothetical protein
MGAASPTPPPPRFSTLGRVMLRDGDPFARGTTDEITRALAILLNSTPLLCPGTPAADLEFVQRILWS